MNKLICLRIFSWKKLKMLHQSCCDVLSSFIRVILFRIASFWIQLFYFIVLSFIGYFTLIMFDIRLSSSNTSPPKNFDLFFTSVSATTISSMSTVEMEVFSNSQLVTLTILMFLGGEVFTSMLGLQFFRYSKFTQLKDTNFNVPIHTMNMNDDNHNVPSLNLKLQNRQEKLLMDVENNSSINSGEDNYLKYKSINYLSNVVLAYHLVVNFFGSTLVYIYFSFFSTSAKKLLKNKGIGLLTFSVFTTISTFSNCGFVPTNENMMVFRKNSGLLLILIPQILLGNTLFPTCLRSLIWVLKKVTKRKEYNYMLKNTKEMGYEYLVSSLCSTSVGITVLGFIVAQFIVFCAIGWNDLEAMDGLSLKDKFVASMFQVVNARHTGESVFDLSIVSSPILVLFVVMMYLPSYIYFLPRKEDDEKCKEDDEKCEENVDKNKKEMKLVHDVILSPLSYLVIFVILICITESDKIKEDPLNFNVFNIVFEVISAYGNVGFSMGYNCKRRLKTDGHCENKMYGFVGVWSNEGKMILLIVMLFGRLKKFNMKSGRSWKLL